jgi:molecular chaperone DnaK
MVADAESHAADDKARRELIDARNQGDALAYSVEKTLSENRAKVPAGEAAQVEAAIGLLRDTLKADDVAKIRAATDALQQASHALAEQMYKQSQTPPAGHGGSGTSGGPADNDVKDGEVVDAEVVGA